MAQIVLNPSGFLPVTVTHHGLGPLFDVHQEYVMFMKLQCILARISADLLFRPITLLFIFVLW